ncbi:hypothetical protein L210DRAFT_3506274 [Boletus edulis BED1]|uniref:Uncharacterized protein n=1 Tax=Boletus edulis BED1 TaxID=1328754 RepID=A0AAD4GC22_BOLED|nr:hypothetical protein L210DRAFT_3506274 [Boletus edulis BED1]
MPNHNPDTPHADFALPGWVTTPLARHTCLLSLASAYSRKWNPRNLEYPWYEPWVQILQALVADLPPLAVAPQLYLWYYRHPNPRDHRIQPPAQDEGDWYEEGNTTLDSIESIHVGSRRNKYQLVDLAITRKVSRIRPAPTVPLTHAPDDQFYLSRKVDYMGIPVLCELKRGGPRTSNFPTSLEHAHRLLHVASEQLLRQAHHLFEMYPHQEEVLLIAVAGLWWLHRVLPRNESKVATAEEIESEEHAEASTDSDAFEENEIPADMQDGVVDMNVGPDLARDEQDLSGLPSILCGLENVTFQDQISEKLLLHLLMTPANLRLSTIWSRPLLFGTPPSNQVLYLIRQHLESIVNHGYSGTKG